MFPAVLFLVSTLLTLALGYWTFGLVAAAFVGWRLVRGETLALAARKTRDSAPFAVFWFTAMMAIYFCYGQLGAVFGNVVQSTRALIAVVVALLYVPLLTVGNVSPSFHIVFDMDGAVSHQSQMRPLPSL